VTLLKLRSTRIRTHHTYTTLLLGDFRVHVRVQVPHRAAMTNTLSLTPRREGASCARAPPTVLRDGRQTPGHSVKDQWRLGADRIAWCKSFDLRQWRVLRGSGRQRCRWSCSWGCRWVICSHCYLLSVAGDAHRCDRVGWRSRRRHASDNDNDNDNVSVVVVVVTPPTEALVSV